MPVEQIKIVKEIARSDLSELAYLSDCLVNDKELFTRLNVLLASRGHDRIDFDAIEEFTRTATSDVDRIVVFDDEDEDEDEVDLDDELPTPIPLYVKAA